MLQKRLAQNFPNFWGGGGLATHDSNSNMNPKEWRLKVPESSETYLGTKGLGFLPRRERVHYAWQTVIFHVSFTSNQKNRALSLQGLKRRAARQISFVEFRVNCKRNSSHLFNFMFGLFVSFMLGIFIKYKSWRENLCCKRVRPFAALLWEKVHWGKGFWFCQILLRDDSLDLPFSTIMKCG